MGGKKNWSSSGPPVGGSVRSMGPSLLGVKTLENLSSPAGSTFTAGARINMSVHPLLEVACRVISYSPSSRYLWNGSSIVEVSPSPNSQRYVEPDPPWVRLNILTGSSFTNTTFGATLKLAFGEG